MANDCFYELRAKGSEANLKRLASILKYDDKEYALSRIFSAEICDETKDAISIFGDCAWSVYCCMCEGDSTYFNGGTPVFDNGAKRTTIDRLAKMLNLKIEIWSEECGIGFQEHYLINEEGEFLIDDCRDASFDEEDEIIGGFPNYMEFSF